LALAIEEKYDQVRQLIAMGKERGYLLYDEVNDILPAEVHSSEEIDDLLSTFERYGIDIYEDLAAAKAARATADPAVAEAPEVESKDELPVAEESDLDLTPGMLEKTNDPVRMYLREMGTVPLLTREGEVAIAKRIERGQLLVLKTITRSPIILKELLTIGEDLRKGTRSIKEIVQFDDEELTEEKIENKTRKTLKVLDKIAKLYLDCLREATKLERMPKSKKLPYIHLKYRVARLRIEMSQLARSLAAPSSDCSLSSARQASSNAAPTLPRATMPRRRARSCARAARSFAKLKFRAKRASPTSSACSR